MPLSLTTLYRGAFSCSAPKLWNSLPQSVKCCDTLNSFKKCLKTVILTHFSLIQISYFLAILRHF